MSDISSKLNAANRLGPRPRDGRHEEGPLDGLASYAG